MTEHFELAYSSACVSWGNAYCQNSTTGRVALTLDAMVTLWFGWVKSKHDSSIRWRKQWGCTVSFKLNGTWQHALRDTWQIHWGFSCTLEAVILLGFFFFLINFSSYPVIIVPTLTSVASLSYAK